MPTARTEIVRCPRFAWRVLECTAPGCGDPAARLAGMDESFFASLEAELIDRSSRRTRAGARLAVFHNRHRRSEATSIAAA